MPKSVNPLEAMVDQFSEELVRTVEAIPEQDRPFGAVDLTPEEQIDQYLSIRDDPAAFMEIIEKQGMRAAVEYVKAMEGKISKIARE